MGDGLWRRPPRWEERSRTIWIGCLFLGFVLAFSARAQTAGERAVPLGETEVPSAPKQVQVQAVSTDAAIAERLSDILAATGWFEEARVEARDGVVFLDGRTPRQEFRGWAGDLARNTEDVVAVVNRISISQRSPWDFTPAWEEFRRLWRRAVVSLPLLAPGLLLLVLTVAASRLAVAIVRRLLERRLKPLLRDVVAGAAAIAVFLFGLYVVLRVAGLTRLAVTLLGGTGLAGLVVGIAFRDILENFLASILISLRNPFRTGDLVEIAGHLGIVQKVTTRGTVLMDYDGNHVQVPNATVYKGIILNYTANPKRRMEFGVGIGYENAISEAQEIALAILRGHPAVLEDPPPLVLVDRLGAATVDLKLYFWFDGTIHDGPRVRSALIRLVKGAYLKRGISLPDEAREIVFPQGVPVQIRKEEAEGARPGPPAGEEAAEPATAAEGELASAEGQIREQGRRSRTPEEGTDLLESDQGR